MGGWLVRSGQWKKAAITEFEVLSRDLPPEAEKNHENVMIAGLRAEM
jgi:hypothetical protein